MFSSWRNGSVSPITRTRCRRWVVSRTRGHHGVRPANCNDVNKPFWHYCCCCRPSGNNAHPSPFSRIYQFISFHDILITLIPLHMAYFNEIAASSPRYTRRSLCPTISCTSMVPAWWPRWARGRYQVYKDCMSRRIVFILIVT